VTITGWRTSIWSIGNGACVEVGDGVDPVTGQPAVGIRDSQDRSGPVLTFTGDEWQQFAARVRRGEAAMGGDD